MGSNQENVAPASKPQGPKPKSKSTKKPLGEASANTSASRKRKSDVVDDDTQEPANSPEIDDDDPRLQIIDDDCNKVRRKIRTWIDTEGMKVGEFQKAIGVSSGAYQRFMNQSGATKGMGCDTYQEAYVFFKKRELQGLPLRGNKGAGAKPTKKAKKGETTDSLDVSGITLGGEESGHVPVYDTCDEIRKKIRAFLKRADVTQAGLCRAIAASYPEKRNCAASSLNAFLGRKGPDKGNTSVVFYGAYVFFEKRRLKEGKPKSQMREEMEDIWEEMGGMDIKYNRDRGILLPSSASAYVDKYGRYQMVKAR